MKKLYLIPEVINLEELLEFKILSQVRLYKNGISIYELIETISSNAFKESDVRRIMQRLLARHKLCLNSNMELELSNNR